MSRLIIDIAEAILALCLGALTAHASIVDYQKRRSVPRVIGIAAAGFLSVRLLSLTAGALREIVWTEQKTAIAVVVVVAAIFVVMAIRADAKEHGGIRWSFVIGAVIAMSFFLVIALADITLLGYW